MQMYLLTVSCPDSTDPPTTQICDSTRIQLCSSVSVGQCATCQIVKETCCNRCNSFKLSCEDDPTFCTPRINRCLRAKTGRELNDCIKICQRQRFLRECCVSCNKFLRLAYLAATGPITDVFV